MGLEWDSNGTRTGLERDSNGTQMGLEWDLNETRMGLERDSLWKNELNYLEVDLFVRVPV